MHNQMVIYNRTLIVSTGGWVADATIPVVPPPPPAPPGPVVRAISSPYLYIGWSALVLGGLVATWPIDPYAFALATLVAGLGTVFIGLAGIIAQVKGQMEMRARMTIAAFVTVAGLIVVGALVMLTRVNWA